MKIRKFSVVLLAVLLVLSMLSACQKGTPDSGSPALESRKTDTSAENKTETKAETEAETTAETAAETDADSETTAEASAAPENPSESAEEPAPVEKNGDVYILYTSDIHCGVDQGFGLAGLKQIRDSLEAQGYTTLLVDNGDAIQGETLGTLTNGKAMTLLMNSMKYDAAIPGNHEFDYGMDCFLELTKTADFPYISCNFMKEGEPMFPPYVILEAAGMKIAFVGVTTPSSITSSTPTNFQNEAGEYIYSFLQDEDGTLLYAAVQEAVDAARAEGADYVYIMGHLGMKMNANHWTYAEVISHTTGIDVFLDGHSHDTEQVVMKNLNGENVVRTACGTKLACIGYSHISPENGIVDTGIWSWPNQTPAYKLLGIENEASKAVAAAQADLREITEQVVAKTSVTLTVNDPEETDTKGNPIRMIRRAETNLGDFCADAFRAVCGSDIAVMNGGGIRTGISKGEITYGDIISVFPFGNEACVVRATGQQVLDALEWGARNIPGETGAFLQVSGLSYEIDLSVPSGCLVNEDGKCGGFEGERRVKNAMVGDEPLDPVKEYTVAGTNYTLLEDGDGQTAFAGAEVLISCVMIDNQLLIEYITGVLGGEIGGDYADPYGQGRITIIEE